MHHAKHSARLGARFHAAAVAALLLASPAAANDVATTPTKTPVKTAPDTKRPHELPTYSGEREAFHAPVMPPRPSEIPDALVLYNRALECWPVPSFFDAEISLEGRIRSDRSSFLDETTGAVRGADRYGVGIVARVPLYSAMEMHRQREREYIRRTKLADAVGSFIAILAERQKHVRKLQLMRALERRSQERVKIGVTETGEQVSYLEKVASLEGTLLQQRGQLEKSRLKLIGHCATSRADDLDAFIYPYMPKF